MNVNVDVDLNVDVDVDLNVNVDVDLNVNVVIPIRKNECRVEVLVSSVLTENQLSSVPQPNKRKAIYVTPLAVELCYAMTINKAQGQTTGKIIININRTTARSIHLMKLQTLYVALSRVRTSDDLRFFPKFNPGSWKYLNSLELNDNLLFFLKSYDPQTGILKIPPMVTPTARNAPPSSALASVRSSSAAVAPRMSSTATSRPTIQVSSTIPLPDLTTRRHPVNTIAPIAASTTVTTTMITSTSNLQPAMQGSAIFVPLILTVLSVREKYSNYSNIDSIVASFGKIKWNRIVAAYKLDFRSRNITVGSVSISSNGYIDATTQESLLYTTTNLGNSTVSDLVFNELMTISIKHLTSPRN